MLLGCNLKEETGLIHLPCSQPLHSVQPTPHTQQCERDFRKSTTHCVQDKQSKKIKTVAMLFVSLATDTFFKKKQYCYQAKK
jgi:hypothetical protein